MQADYQKLLSEVIKKQILILGPDITLAKVRKIPGITVADDGSITNLQGDPKAITQQLIQEFMELSELIVKKTMEPLLVTLLQPTPATESNQPLPTTVTPSPSPTISEPLVKTETHIPSVTPLSQVLASPSTQPETQTAPLSTNH